MKIVRTSTSRIEIHNGIAQAVVTATWSDGRKTTESLMDFFFNPEALSFHNSKPKTTSKPTELE